MNKKIYLKVCKIFDDIFDLEKKKIEKIDKCERY